MPTTHQYIYLVTRYYAHDLNLIIGIVEVSRVSFADQSIHRTGNPHATTSICV